MTAPVPKRAPIEAKAQAAGAGGFVAGAIIWVLQTYVFKGTVNPGLVSLVYAVAPALLALGAAYAAPHTPRPVVPITFAQPSAVKVQRGGYAAGSATASELPPPPPSVTQTPPAV